MEYADMCTSMESHQHLGLDWQDDEREPLNQRTCSQLPASDPKLSKPLWCAEGYKESLSTWVSLPYAFFLHLPPSPLHFFLPHRLPHLFPPLLPLFAYGLPLICPCWGKTDKALLHLSYPTHSVHTCCLYTYQNYRYGLSVWCKAFYFQFWIIFYFFSLQSPFSTLCFVCNVHLSLSR